MGRNRAGFGGRLVLLAAILACSGCVLFVGGAALGGAMVSADRRSVGMQVEDIEIEHRVNNAFDDRFSRKSVRIDVTSYNQRVLLAGQVPTEKDRSVAEALAGVQTNVRQVTNELTIGSLAGLGSPTDDTLLAGKVRAALLDVPGLPAQVVKTTCTNGVIYLLGRVGREEAELAKAAASRVNGVKRVVALFELLTDAELAQIKRDTPAPPPRTEGPRAGGN